MFGINIWVGGVGNNLFGSDCISGKNYLVFLDITLPVGDIYLNISQALRFIHKRYILIYFNRNVRRFFHYALPIQEGPLLFYYQNT